MEEKLSKLTFKKNLKSSIKGLNKNWRLTQLMTLLEQSQGLYPLNKKSTTSIQTSKDTIPGMPESFLRNEVTYKNTFITNPLIENKQIIKENITSNNLSKNKSPEYFRYPINANFVAQWLSENIVSSKTYKLALLCDRVIKAANLKKAFSPKGDEQAKSKELLKTQLKLVGIKIVISGRILGAEIATSKTFKSGQIPNNTIKVLKDRGFALAKTRSGTIGIKVTYFWKNS